MALVGVCPRPVRCGCSGALVVRECGYVCVCIEWIGPIRVGWVLCEAFRGLAPCLGQRLLEGERSLSDDCGLGSCDWLRGLRMRRASGGCLGARRR